MIKSLRIRFVLNMMLVLVFVFSLIGLSFHLYYYYVNNQEDASLLLWIADTENMSRENLKDFYTSELLEYADGESDLSIITVKYDKNHNSFAVNSNKKMSDLKEQDVLSVAKNILKSGKRNGKVKHYKYLVAQKDYGCFLALIDYNDANLLRQYSEYIFPIIIVVFSMLILVGVSIFLSRFVTKPAEESMNKQKKFVSDASHELKTPLAAILINAEALKDFVGENRYLINIQSEARRMEKLVKNLLELAKADDLTNHMIIEHFNMSDTVMQMTLPFESTAFESGITYETDVKENIFYDGSSNDIQQLVAILLDNAFKHTNEGGSIQVLLIQNSGEIKFSVYNTGDGISDDNLPHVFERFYSCDTSRSGDRSSYGLGLAIAKAIVERHHGTIDVYSEYGKSAKFIVTL